MIDKRGSSETFRCPGCREEKEFLYDHLDNVVSETRCKCYTPNSKIKPLDEAIKQLEKLFKQQGKKK